MNELGELSSANISKYAEKLGVEYRLLRGDLFRPKLTPPWAPIQKLYMLDKEFDGYDMVVMLDTDIFTRKGMNDNIFTDVQGIGRHTPVQDMLIKSIQRKKPKLANPNAPWWGGSIYRLDLKTRKKLREQIREDEIPKFAGRGNFGDEGLMHRLASLAKLKKCYIPNSGHWNCSSFDPYVSKSATIHIRTKITPKGPKRPKIENYRELVKRGLIE